MSPTERRQDKNTSGEFVTYAHFDTFMEEFRNVCGGLGTKVDNMSARLTDVQIKLTAVDKDIGAIQSQTQSLVKRADGTSAVVRVLEEDRSVRAALKAQEETLGKPVRTIKEKVVEIVTTALVLGTIAIGYNVIRDSMIKDASTKTPPTHATPP